MLEYARSDTHFLLFIYDNLRHALVDRALSPTHAKVSLSAPPPTVSASSDPAHAFINHVLAKSAETCLRVYTKEPCDAIRDKKWGESPGATGIPKSVYEAVHEWRDRVAREEDESTLYVMPSRHLLKISEAPPGDVPMLLRMLVDQRQQQQVSDVVKRRGKELVEVIKRAVKRGQQLRAASAEKQRRPLDAVSRGPPRHCLAPSHAMCSSLFVQDTNDAAVSLFAKKSTLFGGMAFNRGVSAFEDGTTRFRTVLTTVSEVLPKVPVVSVFFFALLGKELRDGIFEAG